jgi:thiamine-phosphate pyrophosphorylase
MLARRSCKTCGVDHRRHRLAQARLYLVCGVRSDAFLESALRGGADIVQLRMKDPSDDEFLLDAARRFSRACAAHAALFILNDRPDLVAAAGADGVHVGQDDTPVARAREIVGAQRLIGLSTHSTAEIEAAGRTDADYIGVGPVHATPTKPGRPAVGTELVAYATGHARTPFFAIGGIDLGNVDAVRAAGAQRIAVVRALTDSDDPEATARELRSEARVGAT